MPDAISNTSPLLYLYQIEALSWLGVLFDEVWVPQAVIDELAEGRLRGYDVPDPNHFHWLHRKEPQALPSEWLALDLGPGELAAMALALENPQCVMLLDDALARRIAQAAGLTVWGTLKVLLAAKEQGLTAHIAPFVDRLADCGMWLSADVRRRILTLAEEYPSPR
jgi:predicted nucleic acid-binding protein